MNTDTAAEQRALDELAHAIRRRRAYPDANPTLRLMLNIAVDTCRAFWRKLRCEVAQPNRRTP